MQSCLVPRRLKIEKNSCARKDIWEGFKLTQRVTVNIPKVLCVLRRVVFKPPLDPKFFIGRAWVGGRVGTVISKKHCTNADFVMTFEIRYIKLQVR